MKKLMNDAVEVFVVAFAGVMGMALAALLVMLGIFLMSSKAKAQDGDRRDSRWATQRFCAHYSWDGSCTRYRYERRPFYARPENGFRRYRDPVRYYAAPREWDGERDDQRRCHATRSAVGDQHLTVDGAKKAANDAWAGLIRFHLGESAMDLSNAREITYVCSRSSIKEGGVTTLGQTLTRCEISAQPCRPLRLPAGEER